MELEWSSKGLMGRRKPTVRKPAGGTPGDWWAGTKTARGRGVALRGAPEAGAWIKHASEPRGLDGTAGV